MNFIFKNNQTKIVRETPKLVTFSTCWYILKSKFSANIYCKWISNLLSIVKNFNLVIYTNTESYEYLLPLIDSSNTNIKVIFKPMEEFYTYKYKGHWIKNHEKSNMELHKHTDWKLNMLWNEKIFFVNETIKNRYFNSLYYGWCDIGYFRNRPNDIHTTYLKNWPNPVKMLSRNFMNRYIHYACVQNEPKILERLSDDITKHYANKLETPPTIKYTEICFAGGFFILRPEVAVNYMKIYEEKLNYYFTNDYFIKDDQTIIMDIIFTNSNMFYIHTENDIRYDNWFMFQRALL